MKNVLALSVATLLALGLSACDNDDEPKDDKTTSAEAESADEDVEDSYGEPMDDDGMPTDEYEDEEPYIADEEDITRDEDGKPIDVYPTDESYWTSSDEGTVAKLELDAEPTEEIAEIQEGIEELSVELGEGDYSSEGQTFMKVTVDNREGEDSAWIDVDETYGLDEDGQEYEFVDFSEEASDALWDMDMAVGEDNEPRIRELKDTIVDQDFDDDIVKVGQVSEFWLTADDLPEEFRYFVFNSDNAMQIKSAPDEVQELGN